MKDLHNWFEKVDQLVVSIAIIFELVCFVLKELDDSVGRLAVLELLGRRVFGKVYPSFVEVVSQGSIENKLKVVRRLRGGHRAGTDRGIRLWGDGRRSLSGRKNLGFLFSMGAISAPHTGIRISSTDRLTRIFCI